MDQTLKGSAQRLRDHIRWPTLRPPPLNINNQSYTVNWTDPLRRDRTAFIREYN